MSSSNWIRWSGLAAMLAGVLGILTAPIMTIAYFLTEEGADVAPSWGPALGNLLDPFLNFASPEMVYATYGKVYFLVFLGFALGLAGLYGERRGRAGRLERWGFRLVFVGLLLNLLGNVLDYWILENTVFEEVGFVASTRWASWS